MKYYILDFYDLDCRLEAEKSLKKFKGTLKFPNGEQCSLLLKSHNFCEATVLKVLDGTAAFESFVKEHQDYFNTQTRARLKLDIMFKSASFFLMFILFILIIYCFIGGSAFIFAVLAVTFIYRMYIYPKLILMISDKHLALLVHHKE